MPGASSRSIIGSRVFFSYCLADRMKTVSFKGLVKEDMNAPCGIMLNVIANTYRLLEKYNPLVMPS